MLFYVITQLCPTAFWRTEGCLPFTKFSKPLHLLCCLKKKLSCLLLWVQAVCWHFLLVNVPASGRFLPYSSSCSPSPSQTPNDIDITNFSKSLPKGATLLLYLLKMDWNCNCLQSQLISHIETSLSLIYGHTLFLSKPNTTQSNSQTSALSNFWKQLCPRFKCPFKSKTLPLLRILKGMYSKPF